MKSLRKIFIVSLIISSPFLVKAQDAKTKSKAQEAKAKSKEEVARQEFRGTNAITSMDFKGMLSTFKPGEEGGVKGTYYYSEDWYPGTVYFANGEVMEGQMLRYDMKLTELELNLEEGIKVAKPAIVSRFEWKEANSLKKTTFVSTETLKFAEEPLEGYIELLADGAAKAFEYHYYTVAKADYNEVTDVGNKFDRILKKEKYYAEIDGVVHELSRRTRKNLKLFGEKSSQVKKYVKANRLSFKEPNEIAKIIEYYNTLN